MNTALETAFEKAVADTIFNTSNYATDNKVTLTGTDKFSDGTNSDPFGVIATGVKAARKSMGIKPNTMVMGFDAYDALAIHPKVLAKLSANERALISPEILATLFKFKKILVGESIYASDDGTHNDIWADDIALLYSPADKDMAEGVPVHTVVFELEGALDVVEVDREETIAIKEYREYVIKNVSTENGYLIHDVA